MYALNLAEDGRICSVTYPEYAPENAVLVDTLPEGDISDWRYVGGAYVYDPPPVEESEATPTQEERIRELEQALELLLSGVTE